MKTYREWQLNETQHQFQATVNFQGDASMGTLTITPSNFGEPFVIELRDDQANQFVRDLLMASGR